MLHPNNLCHKQTPTDKIHNKLFLILTGNKNRVRNQVYTKFQKLSLKFIYVL